MVPSDWDLAPKCICGPNFISYLIGESPTLSAASLDSSESIFRTGSHLWALPPPGGEYVCVG